LSNQHKKLSIENGCTYALLKEGCNLIKNNQKEQAKELFKKSIELGDFLGSIALAIADNDIEQAIYLEETHEDKIAYPEEHNPMKTIAGMYFMMGNNAAAEKYYKKALEIGVGSDLYADFGRLYKEQNKDDLAIHYYKIAFERNESSHSLIGLGEIYYEMGKLDVAQTFFEDERFKNDSDAAVYLALIHYHKKDIPTAEQYLQRAQVAPPSFTDPQQVKIYVENENRRESIIFSLKELATAYYEEKKFDKALEYFIQSFELSNNNETLICIGNSYLKMNQFALAENTFRKLLQKDPFDAYYGCAKIEKKKGNSEREEALLKESLKHKSHYSFRAHEKALTRLVHIYENNNNDTLKEFYLEQLLTAASYDYCFELGVIYQQKNNIYWAKKFYKKAAEEGWMSANYISSMYNLGAIYTYENKIEKAKNYFEKAAIFGDPDSNDALGILYTQQKNFSEAEKFFLIAIKQGSINSIDNLAILYCRQDRIDEAIKLLLKSIDQNGPDSNRLFILGYLFEKSNKLELAAHYYKLSSEQGNLCATGIVHQLNGNFEQAEKYFNQALEEKRYEAYYHLSILCEQIGKPKQAKEYLKMADEHGVFY